MREIADLRPRALDDVLIGFDQRIEFVLQLLDLDRQLPIEALRLARADGGEPRSICFNGRKPYCTWKKVASSKPEPSIDRATIMRLRNWATVVSISSRGPATA